MRSPDKFFNNSGLLLRNPGRACRPSRSEFSVVFPETRVNTGQDPLGRAPRKALQPQTQIPCETIGLKNLQQLNKCIHIKHAQNKLAYFHNYIMFNVISRERKYKPKQNCILTKQNKKYNISRCLFQVLSKLSAAGRLSDQQEVHKLLTIIPQRQFPPCLIK